MGIINFAMVVTVVTAMLMVLQITYSQKGKEKIGHEGYV
jgi:hypothetical protein